MFAFSASSDMVSTCQDTGTWKPVTITCVQVGPVSIVPWDHLSTDGSPRRPATAGRALNYDPIVPNADDPFQKMQLEHHLYHSQRDNLPSPSHPINRSSYQNIGAVNTGTSAGESPLVMGLAIVASLLLVALLVLLTVMGVRRKCLTSPGSLNSLLKQQNSPDSSVDRKPPAGHTNYDSTAYLTSITSRGVGNQRQGDASNYYNGGSLNNGNRTPISGSLYQHNILNSLSGEEQGNNVNLPIIVVQDSASLSGSVNRLDEPPYERVRTRSEHSYETIRKLSQRAITNLSEDEMLCYQQEPNYERVPGDKGSLWYESVDKGSVGYETVPGERLVADRIRYLDDDDEISNYQIREIANCQDCKKLNEHFIPCSMHKGRDPGYEKIKEKDHHYEALKEKIAPFESITNKNDNGYETMPKDVTNVHGYETLKHKQSPTVGDPNGDLDDTLSISDSSGSVPDILQGIDVDDAIIGIVPLSQVPPEILALYAQVDKSKKKPRNASNISNYKCNDSPKDSIGHVSTISDSSSLRSASMTSECFESMASSGEHCNSKPTPPPRPKNMAPQPLQLHQPQSSPQLSFINQIQPNPLAYHHQLQQSQSDSSQRSSIRDQQGSRGSREFYRYVKSSSDDLTRPPSAASDYTSPSGTLRPLPPIPKQ